MNLTKSIPILQTIMHYISSLVFLLAVLPLSTLTTADQLGGAAALDDRNLTDRFCIRGRRFKIQAPPSQTKEKPLEKTSMADAEVEAEKLSEDDEEEKAARKRSKEIKTEDKAADFANPEQKKEETNKYKPPPASASPTKPKGSNYDDLEDMN